MLNQDNFEDFLLDEPEVFTPFAARIVQTGKDAYEVHVKRFVNSVRWEKFGHTVHIDVVAESVAERLMNPFQPRVIRRYP